MTLVKQEERMGEGARGMTSICWVPIVWLGIPHPLSLQSSHLKTLGVWCLDPHFTDGDAESESNSPLTMLPLQEVAENAAPKPVW